MQAPRETHQYDDTAVFFFSDHGDYTGDYGLVEKTQNTFEDGLTQVSLVVKPPRGTPIQTGDARCSGGVARFPCYDFRSHRTRTRLLALREKVAAPHRRNSLRAPRCRVLRGGTAVWRAALYGDAEHVKRWTRKSALAAMFTASDRRRPLSHQSDHVSDTRRQMRSPAVRKGRTLRSAPGPKRDKKRYS